MQGELQEVCNELAETRHERTEYDEHESREPARDKTPDTGNARTKDRPMASPDKSDEASGVKIREADKVIVPQCPNTTNVYTWKTNLTRAVVVASGNPDFERITDESLAQRDHR